MDHLWKFLWQGVGLVGIRPGVVLRGAVLGWGGGFRHSRGARLSSAGCSIVLVVVAEGVVGCEGGQGGASPGICERARH